MPARPTEFCAKCGEYIKLDSGLVYQNQSWTTVKKLVHINADGVVIYRAHAPVPEKES